MRRPKGQPEKRPRGEASERTAGKRSPEEKPAREFRDRRPAQRKRPPERLRRSFCLLQRFKLRVVASPRWLSLRYAARYSCGRSLPRQADRRSVRANEPNRSYGPTSCADQHSDRPPSTQIADRPGKKRKYPITAFLAVLPSLLSSPSCRPHRLAVSVSRYPLRL